MAQSSDYSNYAAIDPSTGIAYIASYSGNPPFYAYNTFQSRTTNVTKANIPVPPDNFSVLSAVWSTVRKSLLCYGTSGPVDEPVYTLMEYQPSTKQWTDHVPAIQEIFQERAACAVVGDYFIAAGGTMTSGSKQRIVVFNIKLNQWTDTYEPPQTATISTGAGSSSSTMNASPVAEQGNPSGDGTPSGAKIGIIAGGSSALLAFLICGALLIRRRKTRQSSQSSQAELMAGTFHKNNPGWTEKDRSNPNDPAYPGKDMDPYSRVGLNQEHRSRDDDAYEYAYYVISPLNGNSFSPTNADISPIQTSSSQSLANPTKQDHEYASSHHGNKSTLEPSKSPQQHPIFQNKALRKASSSSPDGFLRIEEARSPQKRSSNASSATLNGRLMSQDARNIQHHSSSTQTVAVRQWQCTQQGQNQQYIPPPPSIPTTPALAHYHRHGLQKDHVDYQDRSDHRVIYHEQLHDESEDGPVYYNHDEKCSAADYDRHGNDPQACYGDPDEDQDYLEMYQDSRMNAPQEHDHSSSDSDPSLSDIQHRLDPQDHTRHSAASRLEFYQSLRLNNPQDCGDQTDQDDDTLYQEIQRIRAQQEEHIRQRQNLERLRLEKEEKLHTLAGRVKYPSPRVQL
ncbi:hypothetical protein BGZ70_004963 [Mortierella alpina]|uniref:Uncharacterized protein n=1 Tax=Mortierella alpina TaxID=64518 RepID=A0A9P6JEH5_MORAP|nr:hypothetical protein BGZ70_004963 [Mortierella alpina]